MNHLIPNPAKYPASWKWLETHQQAAKDHYRILAEMEQRYVGPKHFYVNRTASKYVEYKFKPSDHEQVFWSIEIETRTKNTRVRFFVNNRKDIPPPWRKQIRVLQSAESTDLYAIDISTRDTDSIDIFLVNLRELLDLSASFSGRPEQAAETDVESGESHEAFESQSKTFTVDGLRDERKKVVAEVVRRQGQQRFREHLLRAYGNRCAISGCGTPAALEAAHIFPYRGPGCNAVCNGILLRRDLHALWDAGLLAIHPINGEVWVSTKISDEAHRAFDGVAPNLPKADVEKPDRKALQVQWEFAMGDLSALLWRRPCCD